MTEILRKLGRYELIRRIAIGGMGEIFLARTHGTAGFTKRVIIKTILPHLAEEQEFITKFLDEGHILVQLTHGNIVPVIDMNEVDGEYYIAMEYIAGRDLREVTKRLAARGDIMPMDMALYLVSELCKGLSYAHRKTDEQGNPLELVHRDISPSNVLISSEGEVKIIDFGIARATTKSSRTVSGRIQGKFCYMSPEQASGKPLDHRSDIFSTGVVLYELLTGMRPFEGSSDLESLELVRDCKADPPSTLNPQIPEPVDEIVMRALARASQQRYDTCDELQSDLLQYLYTEGAPPSSKDVIAFLHALFPEGVERKELRSGTNSRSAPIPGAPMSLEDALEQELALMGATEHTPSLRPIDPLTVTAISKDGPTPAHHTATLAPATPEQVWSTPEPLENPEPEAPAPVALPQEEEEGDESDITPPSIAPPAPSRRSRLLLVSGVVAIAAFGAVLGVMFWTPETPKRSVVFQTLPVGASIYLDGALLPEKQTPTTLKLQLGEYSVRFEREGFESTGELRLELPQGEGALHFPEKAFAMRAQKTHTTVIVESVPSQAEIVVAGERKGKTPAPVALAPSGANYIKLRHPHCEDQVFQVPTGTSPVRLTMTNCQEPTTPPQAPEADSKPASVPGHIAKKKASVRVTALPTHATLYINGRRQRSHTTTLKGLSPLAPLTIRATAAGHTERTIRTTARAAKGAITMRLTPSQQGCFNVRFDRAPFLAHVELDGKRLPGKDRSGMSRRQDLGKRKTSVGKHTLKVWNELANKKPVITTFEVTAGASCTTIDAWSGKVTR